MSVRTLQYVARKLLVCCTYVTFRYARFISIRKLVRYMSARTLQVHTHVMVVRTGRCGFYGDDCAVLTHEHEQFLDLHSDHLIRRNTV